MLYLHDVWVNWFEGEENGYNVCYYHEWRKTDRIELLDQIPLLYIEDDLYHFIENDMQDLPKSLLDQIYRRAYVRKGQSRSALEYASVVTNGVEVIAFDTIGYQVPIRKSRLIPRQERIVFEMIKEKERETIQLPTRFYEKQYSLLSMSPELIYGLTRRERQLKQVLMMALDQLRTSKNIEELRYWLIEWNPKKYPMVRYMDKNEVWKALYEGVKDGWSKAHEELGEKLIKRTPFLEKMWEHEQNKVQNTSK